MSYIVKGFPSDARTNWPVCEAIPSPIIIEFWMLVFGNTVPPPMKILSFKKSILSIIRVSESGILDGGGKNKLELPSIHVDCSPISICEFVYTKLIYSP